jgi:hypothetical protein
MMGHALGEGPPDIPPGDRRRRPQISSDPVHRALPIYINDVYMTAPRSPQRHAAAIDPAPARGQNGIKCRHKRHNAPSMAQLEG